MPNPKTHRPLFVDLDGTLIKSDLMLESVLLLIKKNPLAAFMLPLWLLKGRANLKHQLAQRVDIPYELLPPNPEFKAYIQQQEAEGRNIVLISASNQQQVRALSNHYGFFIDAIGSDEQLNLKAENKLLRILQLNQKAGFSYAGNSSADLPIWDEADEVVMVNCAVSLAEKLKNKTNSITRFDTPGSKLHKFFLAMRPHQWLKNGLLFLPLILSHQIDQLHLFLQACIGFLSFSLCASSVYFLNDMLDLNSDRQHHAKRSRQFASGELALAYGFLGAPILLAASFAVALLLPANFIAVLFLYWILTSLYSLFLKRLFMLDVLTLAVLYTLRIIAGSAAIAVATTFWLLAFSFFLFLSIAMAKRFTEFSNLSSTERTSVAGRAYSTAHLKMLAITGGCSSLIAVAVFAFYINAPDTTELYTSPGLLWLICPLLVFLLGRIWIFAQQGKLNEDPVLFAISDHPSQAVTLMCGLIIWLAI
ncbi:MAG: UbiA family prenyltransferase [Pseudohongiella sp.]|nr:UbiA family prenyltransferase [Pseudohongiella sp.]